MAETEQLSRLPNSLRVSHQPVMVAGLTGSEFLMAIALGFLVFITVSAVTLPILGAFHFSLLAGSIAGVAAGIALRASIVHIKRQKPVAADIEVSDWSLSAGDVQYFQLPDPALETSGRVALVSGSETAELEVHDTVLFHGKQITLREIVARDDRILMTFVEDGELTRIHFD